jgi:hypothetical protein
VLFQVFELQNSAEIYCHCEIQEADGLNKEMECAKGQLGGWIGG